MAKKVTLKGAEQKTNPAVKKGGSGYLQTTGQGDTTTSLAIAASETPNKPTPTTTPTTTTPQTSTTAQTLTDAFANADPTSQAQATTKEEVDAQDARTRLWQSLSNSYQAQIDKSEKDYDKAKVNTENQMLNKGMQRSSYALALQTQLEDQKAKATKDILSSQIADYQNRLSDLEYKEQQQSNWQAEFDAGRADAAWSQEWQQKLHADELAANDQKVAYDMVLRMLETKDKPSAELLKRAGLTYHDYEQMKSAKKKSKKSGSGGSSKNPTDPGEEEIWKKLGYKSEKEYLAALYAANLDNNIHHDTSAYWTSGTTRDEYQKKQAQLNGIGKKK